MKYAIPNVGSCMFVFDCFPLVSGFVLVSGSVALYPEFGLTSSPCYLRFGLSQSVHPYVVIPHVVD